MAEALTGKASVGEYYEHAVAEIRKKLVGLDDGRLLVDGESATIERLVGERLLSPVEEDATRKVAARQEKETRQGREPIFDTPRLVEIVYDVIGIPLVPRDSNINVLQLRPPNFWAGLDGIATFNERVHVLEIRDVSDRIAQKLEMFRSWETEINAQITDYEPSFRARVTDLVGSRLSEVSARRSDFEQRMSNLGIKVQERSDARLPVDVAVRHEVKVLRQERAEPKHPAEPYLEPASLDLILKLLYQAGQGFETAPSVYGKLEEEDLRMILVGYLNAVFESNSVATAETFSHKGKTDILLAVPGGAVLVAECKYWDGAAKNCSALEQLFGYLTWRHTAGVLVNFSRNKGLTRVVAQSQSAIQNHPSYRGGLQVKTPTYFTSEHEHPTDQAKTVAVHHLLFDLAS